MALTALAAPVCLYARQPVATVAPATQPQTAMPQASVAAGAYTAPQTVTLRDTTAGASIYYTLDGSTPTSASSVYKTSLTVARTLTLKAIAVAPAHAASKIAVIAYAILKPQTIAFQPIGGPVTYGATPLALAASATSGLPVTFRILSGSGTVQANSLVIDGAGTFVVAATQAGDSVWAAAPQVTQSLSVARATLTVQAQGKHMLPGQPVPPLDYQISGFVDGDTAANAVTGQPVLTTTATPASPQGIYPIDIALGTLAARNYRFALVPGKLAVTLRTVNFMGDSQTQGSIHGNCQHSWPEAGDPPCWTNLVQQQKGWNFGKDISQDGDTWAGQIKLMLQPATGGPLTYEPDSITVAGLGQNDANRFSSVYINCLANPSPGDTLTLNGTPVTFVAQSPIGNEVSIGSSPAQTCANLQRFACPNLTDKGCGSPDPNIAKSTYSYAVYGPAAVRMQPVTPGYVQAVATSNPAAFTFQQPATTQQIVNAIQTQAEAAAIIQSIAPQSEAGDGAPSLIAGQQMRELGAGCQPDDGSDWGTGFVADCGSGSTLAFTVQGSAIYVVYEAGPTLSSTFYVTVGLLGQMVSSPLIATALPGYLTGYTTLAVYRMANPFPGEPADVRIHFVSGSTGIAFGAGNGVSTSPEGKYFALWETFDAANNTDSVYSSIRTGERLAMLQLAQDGLPVIDIPLAATFNCQRDRSLCTADGEHPSTSAMPVFAGMIEAGLGSIY